MNHGSLFSGIGGFDLAAEWMGWTNVFHCEWNEFGKKILKYYWPNAISYGDITKTDFTVHRGGIDIITGGFPCQPYSLAGKRKGKEDERHLWPEMLRAIREIQPDWVVGENVPGLINWSKGLVFEEVQADLEAEGYEVIPFILPACAVDAPHRRDRVWFIAHSLYSRNGQPREGNRQYEQGINIKKQGGGSQHSEQFNQYGDNGSSSNTIDTRTNIRLRTNGNGEEKDERRAEQSQSELRENGGSSPDTEGLRVNRTQEHENDCRQGGKRGRCNVNNACKIQGWDNAPDTSNQGLQGRKINGNITETKGQGEFYGNIAGQVCHRWEDFPTQPPLRSRDDGLSSQLAGITVSKHRNESIKAYGNAIVPQVVYQIFKTIEQYESLNP